MLSPVAEVICKMLPEAVGVALSPLPIVVVILMLTTARARANGPAYLGGWTSGLMALYLSVSYLVKNADASPGGGTDTAVAMLTVALGIILLAIAFNCWRRRPKTGEKAKLPGWMKELDRFDALKAFAAGAFMAAANTKNLPLTVAAAAQIGSSALSGVQAASAILIYVLIGAAGVGMPVIVYFLGGKNAEDTLAKWKDWLAENNEVILAVLFLILGTDLLGKGLGDMI
jgi:hypothetical protein